MLRNPHEQQTHASAQHARIMEQQSIILCTFCIIDVCLVATESSSFLRPDTCYPAQQREIRHYIIQESSHDPQEDYFLLHTCLPPLQRHVEELCKTLIYIHGAAQLWKLSCAAELASQLHTNSRLFLPPAGVLQNAQKYQNAFIWAALQWAFFARSGTFALC